MLVFFSLIYSSKVNLIKNPYIRAECLEIVEYFFITEKGQSNKLIVLFNDPLIKEIFIYSLIRVFIDSERLGGSNQFYEKFNHRYKLLLLIDSIKNQISINDQLIYYAKSYKEDCILMVNFLINDLTFMGDETIDRLKSIKAYEDLKNNQELYNSLSEEDKKNKLEKFEEDSKRAKNSIPLFKSYLEFTVTISNNCQSIIIEYKLGQKLANLLNYLLNMFASKSGSALKVSNLHQYKFDPKEFLSFLIQCYSAFSEHEEFLKNIVSDERSFKIKNFTNAVNVVENNNVHLNFMILDTFNTMIKRINLQKENVSEAVDYDDAPEEFICPISADIMEDPVQLPSSRQIVDRHTIEQHLLSDPKDPFSRAPLLKTELIPLPELKLKIDAYKVSKRK